MKAALFKEKTSPLSLEEVAKPEPGKDDFLSMLDFIHKHKITPVIDKVFPLTEVNEAFNPMEEGGQFGKIIYFIIIIIWTKLFIVVT